MQLQEINVVETLGCHVVELNEALNLKADIPEDATEAERQKAKIKEAVLSYQKVRNKCLKPSFVAEKLGIKSDEFEKGSIAEDLEHRAKELTL